MEGISLRINADDVGSSKSGIVYVQSYKVVPRENKFPYITGELKKCRQRIPFKVWDSNLVSQFSSSDLTGKYINCTVKVAEYNGSFELHIISIIGFEIPSDLAAFKSPIDYEAYYKKFCDYLTQKLPKNWLNVVNAVFSAIPNVNMYERFKLEYAGARMHDAYVGGLLHHTYKMLKILDACIENDPALLPYADRLRVGVILHDIGKIECTRDGVYTENSFISHRTRAVGYLERKRDTILQSISETELMHIEAIIMGHHNGFDGEPATTAWSYIVHLIDMLDAHVTGITDQIDNISLLKRTDAGEPQVWTSERNLTL